MTLISLLIALLLDRFLNPLKEWKQLDLFTRYARKLCNTLSRYGDADSYLGLALILLPVLVVTALIQDVLEDFIFGLGGLVFSIIVLILMLGRNVDEDAEDFIEAYAADDEDKITQATQAIVGEREFASARDRLQGVAETLLVVSNQRLFAVVFWFLLLGPVGAVLYRLSDELTSHDDICGNRLASRASSWLALLDWAPARLTALAFGLTGSLEQALTALRYHFFNGFVSLAADNREVLASAGTGAMMLDDYLRDDVDAGMVSTVMGLLSNLVMRALVVWIVVIALMTIANIF
jgi:AmpE protein